MYNVDSLPPAEKAAAVDAMRQRWVRYRSTLHLPQHLDALLALRERGEMSSINRIYLNARYIKLNVTMHRDTTSVITLSASRDGTSSIYAFIYCDGTTPKYVCTGPTYRSQDGEYRGRLIPFKRYVDLYDANTAKFNSVDELIAPRIEAGRLAFQANFYPAKGVSASALTEIVSGRLPARLFHMCWVADSFTIHYGCVENHINPAYQHLMFMDELDDDAARIHANHRKEFSLHYAVLCLYDAICIPWPPRAGQKIIPLTAGGMTRGDVLREFNLTARASNLVLNGISPSFAFVNDWFYVNGAHGGLFDNYAMHERYERGKLGTDIAGELRRTRARADAPELSGLSARIEAAAEYADNNITLIDRACVVTSEHVGNTMRDIPKLIASGVNSAEMGCLFRQHGVFRGHVLEFMYALYCLHARSGLIHGDLHMNNICIMQTLFMFDADQWSKVFNAKKAYVMAPDRIYHADHVGLFSMIIDFSRAIQLEHADYASADEQRARLVALAMHFAPKLDMNRLIELSRRDYALLFKICSVIDALQLTTNWSTMFAAEPLLKGARAITVVPPGKPLNVAPGNIELLDEIARMASRLFHELIGRALAGAVDVDAIAWPLDTILERVFAADLMSSALPSPNHVTAYHDPSKPAVYVDAFNAQNTLQYDITDYDLWGPVLTPQGVEASRGKIIDGVREDVLNLAAHKQASGGDDDAAPAWMFE